MVMLMDAIKIRKMENSKLCSEGKVEIKKTNINFFCYPNSVHFDELSVQSFFCWVLLGIEVEFY
jgi:hypothetical protein